MIVPLLNSKTLYVTRNVKLLCSGMEPLDKLLSLPPRLVSPSRDSKQLPGGFLPGLVNLVAGNQHYLSSMLMRLSVNAQLPLVSGGVGATKVVYVECNNHVDPYEISRLALARGLNPSRVHDRIHVSRAFNWDQAVHVVARHVPAVVKPRSVILISGITSFFDPAAGESAFHGLLEMAGGIKRALEELDVYMVLTGPVARGSTCKPAGGNILAHLAGCIVSIDRKHVSSGSTVSLLQLLQHPLLPPRAIKSWEHPAAGRARKKKGGTTGTFSTRSLDDFIGCARR